MENFAERFHYYSDLNFDDFPDAYFLDVENFKDEENLITYYYKLLNLPIHSSNWDAFSEGLIDCTWIDSDEVSLIHKNLPDLTLNDMCIYLKVLAHAVDLHAAGPRQDRQLPQKKVDFKVYFPLALKTRISLA